MLGPIGRAVSMPRLRPRTTRRSVALVSVAMMHELLWGAVIRPYSIWLRGIRRRSLVKRISQFVLALVCVGAPAGAQTIVAPPPHTLVIDNFIVTEGDISDRPYVELGRVKDKSGKLSIVSKSPTKDSVAAHLRKKALKMGADAVVRVTYGYTGTSFGSWGDLKGEGVAIKYK